MYQSLQTPPSTAPATARADRLPALSPDFFVFGCERSGTTLLSALLSEHEDVFVLNDTLWAKALNDAATPWPEKVLRKSVARLVPHRATLARAEGSRVTDAPVPPGAVATFYERLGSFLPKMGYGIDTLSRLRPADLVAASERGELTGRALLTATFHQLVPPAVHRRAHLGEKTPIHLYLSGQLLELFPAARVVTLVRHPVTNVAALARREHIRNLDHAIATYLSCYDHRFEHLFTDERSHVVRYQDLVERPEQTLRGVFRHLGGEPGVVRTTFDFYVRQHYIGTAIDPERDRRLAAMLSRDQVQTIRRRCEPILERFFPEG